MTGRDIILAITYELVGMSLHVKATTYYSYYYYYYILLFLLQEQHSFIVATSLMCKQSCVSITIWEMEIIIYKHF